MSNVFLLKWQIYEVLNVQPSQLFYILLHTQNALFFLLQKQNALFFVKVQIKLIKTSNMYMVMHMVKLNNSNCSKLCWTHMQNILPFLIRELLHSSFSHSFHHMKIILLLCSSHFLFPLLQVLWWLTIVLQLLKQTLCIVSKV